MSKWKPSNIQGRNKNELNACVLILETNKGEGEDYIYYSYKNNDKCSHLINLKGIILASSAISNSLFREDYRVLTILDKKDNKKYKITSRSMRKNYIIAVIMPYTTADNILLYVNNELFEFLSFFFEKFEKSKKLTEVMNKYCEILLYNITAYSLNKDNEDITCSSLSNMPIMNITFTYDETNPCFLIKSPVNDVLRTDVIELMNVLSSDKSDIQHSITFSDPPFFLRGYVLLYKGFVMFNSLNNSELCNLARLAMLHECYERSSTSAELVTCEFLFEKESMDSPQVVTYNKEKKKFIATIIAQREFVIIIYLDVLSKNNCSFDSFYIKRAESLLLSLQKKGFNSIIQNELDSNSIRMYEDKLHSEEKNLADLNLNEFETVPNLNKSSENSFATIKNQKKTTKIENYDLNSKIKGYIDHETNANIIHFSCYDDNECIINTSDINVSAEILKEIYRVIFIEYARIQTNINKIKNRNKLLRMRKIYNYCDVLENYQNVLRSETAIKSKIQKEKFLKNLKSVKINEYALKISVVESLKSIWVCCKIYEHITIEDDANLDEFSNYKIIFVSYESPSPVDIDSFCQDLLLNEMFI